MAINFISNKYRIKLYKCYENKCRRREGVYGAVWCDNICMKKKIRWCVHLANRQSAIDGHNGIYLNHMEILCQYVDGARFIGENWKQLVHMNPATCSLWKFIHRAVEHTSKAIRQTPDGRVKSEIAIIRINDAQPILHIFSHYLKPIHTYINIYIEREREIERNI